MIFRKHFTAGVSLALASVALVGCAETTGPADTEADFKRTRPGATTITASAARCETLDFEGFAHGGTIDGTDALNLFGVGLDVATQAWDAPSGGSLGSGLAKAFDTDSNVPAEDTDLQVSGLCTACAPLDNIIVIEDPAGFFHDPDVGPGGDSRFGGDITITGFSGVSGSLVVTSVTMVDDDDGPLALKVDGTTEAQSTPGADGNVQTIVGFDASLSDAITLFWPQGASGGFDNIEICREGGGEGCTPGYWKQRQHFDSWPAAYETDDTFGSVFTSCGAGDNLQNPESGSICGKTLLEALKLRGGGLNALGRHAVAALLSSSTVSYDLTPGEVIAMVNSALEANAYSSTKNTLAGFNQQNCPLN